MSSPLRITPFFLILFSSPMIFSKIESVTHDYIINDLYLGYRTSPHQHNQITRYKDAERKNRIYSYTLKTNQHGVRYSEKFKNKKANRFLLLYGGSFVLGEGIEETETLSFFFNQSLKNTLAYNMGTIGIGPNYMLAHLLSPQFKKIPKESSGDMIYFYIDNHNSRANGFLQEFPWVKSTPYFTFSSTGAPQYEGSIENARPVYSALIKFMRDYLEWDKIGNFPKAFDSHYRYTCKLIQSSHQQFLKLYPSGRFFVYLHPISRVENHDSLRNCLTGLNVISSDINYTEGDTIKDDGHPTHRLNQKVVREILQKIPYLKKKEDGGDGRI